MKNIFTFPQRSQEKELMDNLESEPEMLYQTARRFQSINSHLSASKRLINNYIINDLISNHLKSATLLDAGAGGGDLALWTCQKARNHGIALKIICLEYDPRMVSFLEKQVCHYTGIEVLQADFLNIDPSIYSFDYVFSNHFLHHFKDSDIPLVLQKSSQIAKRMFLHNDLYRSRISHIFFGAYSIFYSGKKEFTRSDGLLSIKKGFIPSELRHHCGLLPDETRVRIKRTIPGRITVLGIPEQSPLKTVKPKKNRFNLAYINHRNHPSQKREYAKKLFNEITSRYNDVTNVLSFGRDDYWKRALINSISVEKGVIVDLATGTGDLAEAISKKHPDCRIVAIDLTRSMLIHAISEIKNENVWFVEADMVNISLKNNSVSGVCGGYALRNAPDLISCLKELYRIMRPGAKAVFLDFRHSPNPFVHRFHLFLLHFWGGLWGLIWHGSSHVYRYIPYSLSDFPDSKQLKIMIESNGFTNYHANPVMGGMLELIQFTKQ